MRLRTIGAVGLAGAALAAPIPVAAALASTGVNTQWSGSAAADGVRVGVVVNDFIAVSNIVDAGGPAAQASASSFAGSHAIAAYPYPGEVVLTAHGQTSGAAPNYPLVAQSNNGGPSESEFASGPYAVKAASTDDSSTASAGTAAGSDDAGAGITRSQVQVRHDPETGVVTSAAESTIEGLSVAGVLSVGRVHTFASIAAPSTAKPASDTEFGDVRVGGQQVGITDKGLVLAGTDVPLPPDSTANAMLASAGITVHYLAGRVTPTSVVAPGLSVSVVQDVPSVGETTVTYVLGQATAGAQAPASVAADGSAPAGTGSAPAGPVPSSTAGTSTGGTALPGSGTGEVAAGSGAVTAPVTSGESSADAPAVAPNRLAAGTGPSSQSLYLVIAAAAVVTVAAAQLFRILAVKLAWT